MGGTRAIASVAALSLTGCQFYARTSTGVPKQTIRHGTTISVRKDQLPGAGELLADGRVRYVVALDQLCQVPRIVEDRVDQKPRLTGGGVAYFVVSGLVMAGGLGATGHGVVREQEIGASNGGRTAEIAVGVGTVILGAVLIGVGASRAGTQKRALAGDSTAPIGTRADGLEDVPCKDAIGELGEIELVTPWNTKSRGTPDTNGAVTFEVVWAGDMLDPDAPTAESMIAAPWKVAATNAKISTTWQPLGPQLPQALDLARIAKKKKASAKP